MNQYFLWRAETLFFLLATWLQRKQTQIVDHPESSPMAPVAYLRLCSATLSPRTDTVGIEAVKIPPVLDHDSQITLEALTHRSRHVVSYIRPHALMQLRI